MLPTHQSSRETSTHRGLSEMVHPRTQPQLHWKVTYFMLFFNHFFNHPSLLSSWAEWVAPSGGEPQCIRPAFKRLRAPIILNICPFIDSKTDCPLCDFGLLFSIIQPFWLLFCAILPRPWLHQKWKACSFLTAAQGAATGGRRRT